MDSFVLSFSRFYWAVHEVMDIYLNRNSSYTNYVGGNHTSRNFLICQGYQLLTELLKWQSMIL
jgi:hypothetical protein